MSKYRSAGLLLLMLHLGIVTIIEAHAQTDETVSAELETAAKQKLVSSAGALIKAGQFADAYELLPPYQID